MKVYLKADGKFQECTHQFENWNKTLKVYTMCVDPTQVIEVAVAAEVYGEEMPTEVYVCSETSTIPIQIAKTLIYTNKEITESL